MINPLVSICIPTFNGEQFINEAMESAISQTFPNLEIVVSDDASVDNTLAIIELYKDKTDIPIRVYSHEKNGIGSNWNHCIKQAHGEFIKFLFQDDVLKANCIQEMINVIMNDNLIGIVACKREFIVEASFINADSKQWIDTYKDLQGTLELQEYQGLSFLDHNLFASKTFFDSPMNKVGEPTTILFRKNLVNEIGFFRTDLNQVLDYEFCYRVLKKKKIAIINKKLVFFRLHHKQTTVLNKGNDVYGADHKIYERIIFKEYFWFLNSATKKRLLRKFNVFIKCFYDFIDQIKKKINK